MLGGEMSYEIISFDEAPKNLQNIIIEDHEMRNNEMEKYNSSGSIDLGKEKYVFFMSNKGSVPKIIEVKPDETYGKGLMIKHTAEDNESVEFPNTVTIVKLNNYYGEITNVFVSHP